MQIKKRDGRLVEFNSDRIINAIELAMLRTIAGEDDKLSKRIADNIKKEISESEEVKTVEEIQDIVEKKLMASSRKDVAKEYITYRQQRTDERSKDSELFKICQDIIDTKNLDMLRENANLNGESFSGKMSKFGSEASKWYNKSFILPEKIKKCVADNYLYIHDFDQYAIGTTNCIFVPFGKLLRDGFSTGNGSVRPPKSIATAMSLIAIIFQSQQNSQFGGVGAATLDYDLAPYVGMSFKKHFKTALEYFHYIGEIEDDDIFIGSEKMDKADVLYDYAYNMTIKETYQAAESMIHNLNTMSSRSGGQIPFTSINYGTCSSIEGQIVINALLEATISGLGHGETPIFPIQIFKCKKGINQEPGDPNYDLFLKAIECSSKRLYPNFINLDAPFNAKYYIDGEPDTEISSMGCRTRVIADRFGLNHCSGKGNLAFNTVNLVKIGIENGICRNERDIPDEDNFYLTLDEVLQTTLDALLHRFQIQSKQKAKYSDFMMREGVWENGDSLDADDAVGELLKHGSLSIGFIGLAECMKAMYGKHHGDDHDVYLKSLEVIKYMREFCDKKSDEVNLNISLFATPAEGLSGKFKKVDAKEFGCIDGVTDREYYTNSFHVPVYFQTNVYRKIELESPFHELCNAGSIGYVELDGLARNNLAAFMKIIQYALEKNMTYFSINHPIDRCPVCGYEGVIGSQCPKCGVTEDNVVFSRLRRVTGYLTGDYQTRFNSAKQAEVKDRVKHGM